MRHAHRAGYAVVLALASMLLSSCAAKRLNLPSGAGTPLPDFAEIHQRLSNDCRRVRTFTAELSLAGKAGPERLRGRVVAGFEAPASMRLEGVAPFGAPAFILVTGPAVGNGRAVLVLPRDARVLSNANADDVLGALTGVSLGPADLQAILTGCVQAAPIAVSGRLYGGGWAAIDLEGGASVFLRLVSDAWQVRAARLGEWQIEYGAWSGQFPRTISLRAQMPVVVNLTALVSQIEANVAIPPEAFTVEASPGALPITLDDVRASGPLRRP